MTGLRRGVLELMIEHPGGHGRRATFAEQVRSLAPRHWVQTPYRYFPIEPRWLLPLSPAMPWGRAALADVLDVEFLSATERRYNFEDSKIL